MSVIIALFISPYYSLWESTPDSSNACHCLINSDLIPTFLDGEATNDAGRLLLEFEGT